ncbi:hypothetical protein ACFL6E_01070 [Candidatus Neomarinimicrobiota bacterium]
MIKILMLVMLSSSSIYGQFPSILTFLGIEASEWTDLTNDEMLLDNPDSELHDLLMFCKSWANRKDNARDYVGNLLNSQLLNKNDIEYGLFIEVLFTEGCRYKVHLIMQTETEDIWVLSSASGGGFDLGQLVMYSVVEKPAVPKSKVMMDAYKNDARLWVNADQILHDNLRIEHVKSSIDPAFQDGPIYILTSFNKKSVVTRIGYGSIDSFYMSPTMDTNMVEIIKSIEEYADQLFDY